MQGDPIGGLISAIVWMVLLLGIFYFLLWRPQQQQRKKHEEFLSNLKKGDKIVTTGGIVGEIKSIEEKTVTLKVCEGCLIRVLKPSVSSYYQEEEQK
ncbi:MAG: preprotein translocase subunit YajC [Hydrogenothermaceae bacterium]|nr:preprotein translocase subunit YajC [Hydrogenothermaceae bacterium]